MLARIDSVLKDGYPSEGAQVLVGESLTALDSGGGSEALECCSETGVFNFRLEPSTLEKSTFDNVSSLGLISEIQRG